MEEEIKQIEQGIAAAVEAEVASNPALAESAVLATVEGKLDAIVDATNLGNSLAFLKPIVVLIIGIVLPAVVGSLYAKAQSALAAAAGTPA
jgi:hypothetical protein